MEYINLQILVYTCTLTFTGSVISPAADGPVLSDHQRVQEANRKGLAGVWASILAEEQSHYGICLTRCQSSLPTISGLCPSGTVCNSL